MKTFPEILNNVRLVHPDELPAEQINQAAQMYSKQNVDQVLSEVEQLLKVKGDYDGILIPSRIRSYLNGKGI